MENNAVIEKKINLENQFKSGANWFYWIAALSLVNSAISLSGNQWSFIIGLGMTQIIDAIATGFAEQIGILGKAIALCFDLMAAAIFIAFGFFARKRFAPAFIIGMIVYALDGLIFILAQDWLSIAFHVFALIGIFSGMKACKELARLESEMAAPAPMYS